MVMVTVQPVGSSCPAGSHRVTNQSPSNLVYFGIEVEEDLNEAPDWGLIIGACAHILLPKSCFNLIVRCHNSVCASLSLGLLGRAAGVHGGGGADAGGGRHRLATT